MNDDNLSRDVKQISRQYSMKAHMYSLFTGILYLFGGVIENRFRKSVYKSCLPKKGNESVLDICCANGKGTLILAEEFPEGKIDGLDLNSNMIYFANQRTKNLSKVNFHVGNCAKIPFSDNSYSIITAWLALHEIPNSLLNSVIRETKRVLNKNGYLLVFDLTIPIKATFLNRLIYYIFRLFEDESAAKFMMIDQGALLESFGFKLIKKWKVLMGFANVLLLTTKN
ncbi:MAG: class I SAM-dependent methyltransferase [Asgard group archaeon]|nr:class I SAM-dependent methyltransferase [Asgard group archaeon]